MGLTHIDESDTLTVCLSDSKSYSKTPSIVGSDEPHALAICRSPNGFDKPSPRHIVVSLLAM